MSQATQSKLPLMYTPLLINGIETNLHVVKIKPNVSEPFKGSENSSRFFNDNYITFIESALERITLLNASKMYFGPGLDK